MALKYAALAPAAVTLAAPAFGQLKQGFGKALTEQSLRMSVPVDIPELGITAGEFDVQRWIYWNVFKCFYNADWDWDTRPTTVVASGG